MRRTYRRPSCGVKNHHYFVQHRAVTFYTPRQFYRGVRTLVIAYSLLSVHTHGVEARLMGRGKTRRVDFPLKVVKINLAEIILIFYQPI